MGLVPRRCQPQSMWGGSRLGLASPTADFLGAGASSDVRFQARLAQMQRQLASPGVGGGGDGGDPRAAQARAVQQQAAALRAQQQQAEAQAGALMQELQRVSAARQALPEAARAAQVQFGCSINLCIQ